MLLDELTYSSSSVCIVSVVREAHHKVLVAHDVVFPLRGDRGGVCVCVFSVSARPALAKSLTPPWSGYGNALNADSEVRTFHRVQDAAVGYHKWTCLEEGDREICKRPTGV